MHRSISLSIAVALCAMLMLSASANAARHSCAKPGYTVDERTSDYVLLSRDLKRKTWDSGPYRQYVCAIKYGKFRYLGESGVEDGYAEYLSSATGNARYFAYVWGTGSVDAGETDRGITLLDMKTGKELMSRSPQDGGGGALVTSIALTDRGKIGWIVRTSERNPEGSNPKEREVSQVFLRGGKKARRVASSPDIDPYFLRFDEAGKQLLWTIKTESISAD